MNPEGRSALMARIRSKDTHPELVVRKLIHSLGYRYRLHRSDLPGKPDLVFPGKKKVIFVHGCFWHSHNCKRGFKPKTNVEFWQKKLQRNKQRDVEIVEQLNASGWKVLLIWECQIKETNLLEEVITSFLKDAC